MPNTVTGWILFTAACVSTWAASAMATKLVMFGFGRALYHRRDILMTYLFLAAMFASGTLFICVEPAKP